MMKRAFLGAVLAFSISGASAQTSMTRSALEAQNNANITTNGVGSITGAKLNALFGNLITSTLTLLDTAQSAVAHQWVSYIDSSGVQHQSQPGFGDLSGTLVPSQIPAPTATTLGGIESITSLVHNWIAYIDTSGVPHQSQPAFSDISGSVAPAQIPAPTASTLGGIESITSLASNWIAYIDTSGVPHQSQPAFTDISGSAACAQLPALTGNVTSSAGSCATTVAAVPGGALPTFTGDVTNSGAAMTVGKIGGKSIALGAGLTTTGAGATILAFGAAGDTYTFPNSSITVAGLSIAQTWSGAQSFNSGDFILNGSGSGSTTLNAPATGGGTATLFAGSDTVAGKTVANGGTNCSAASGTCLDNITGFGSTGLIDRTGAGTYSFTLPGTGVLTALAANLNASGGIISPTQVRAGDIIYNNGGTWAVFGGNNSGTQVLEENASGAPAWATISGTGTVTSVVASTCLSGGTITTSGTIAVTCLPPGGRLTLTSNTPVITGSVSAATTIYYDCYTGSPYVPVYNGTNYVLLSIGSCQISMGLSATNHVSGNAYDIFGVSNSGTLVICTGPTWTAGSGSLTARGTGAGSTALHNTLGFLTNVNALTHCYGGAAGATDYGSVSADQATYLGSAYMSANGQTAFVFGTSAAGGGASTFYLWNEYNRVYVPTAVQDSTSSFTTTSTTLAAYDIGATGSGLNNRVTAFFGENEDAVDASGGALTGNSTFSTVLGLGLDSTTALAAGAIVVPGGQTVGQLPSAVNFKGLMGLGLHYLQLECAVTSASTSTIYGSAAVAILSSGLNAMLRM